jgi:hypothetical protein
VYVAKARSRQLRRLEPDPDSYSIHPRGGLTFALGPIRAWECLPEEPRCGHPIMSRVM